LQMQMQCSQPYQKKERAPRSSNPDCRPAGTGLNVWKADIDLMIATTGTDVTRKLNCISR
jgi:hypothetical protein